MDISSYRYINLIPPHQFVPLGTVKGYMLNRTIEEKNSLFAAVDGCIWYPKDLHFPKTTRAFVSVDNLTCIL